MRAYDPDANRIEWLWRWSRREVTHNHQRHTFAALLEDIHVHFDRRLLAAGVPTELHVYPGAFHGFNGFAPSAEISRRFNADRDT